MAIFKIGVPVETTEPTIEVTVSPENPLPVGRHTFRLTVTDEAGNTSEPALVEVIVRDTQRPTAIADGPKAAEVGKSFALSGARSSDPAPGKITKYTWTRMETLQPVLPPDFTVKPVGGGVATPVKPDGK